MKNNFLYGIAFFVVIFFVVSMPAISQADTYTMRNLTLNTLGKTLLLNGNETDRDGKLTEFSGVQILKDWKVKYEHKGSSRRMCEPPVLNISFDKTDSKGKPKELFTGVSTYSNYSQLQYQKIRLIPDCDIWNDYFGASDIGFNGQLNVNLREYIIFKIFKKFGIPVSDIVGFANVTFIAPNSGYSGKTFRYMIVQRVPEQDDQIPLTKQYNLNPALYESGDFESGSSPWRLDWNTYNRLTGVTLTKNSDNSTTQLSFDQDTTIKYLLMTDFLNVSDMGFLHNEDGGIDLTTGKIKIIPHGFDASFSCYSVNPSNIDLTRLVNALPENQRSTYQAAEYRIAREIFGNSASLDQMVSLVNEFPYQGVDKQKLIEYLKIRFYQYATYFNSTDFASTLKQPYKSLVISLPFTSKSEYQTHYDAFQSGCYRTPKTLTGVSVTLVESPKLTYNDRKDGLLNFVLEIKTTDLALQMSKSRFSNAFKANLIDSQNNARDVQMYYTPISGNAEDYAGPYYVIPPNSTARFSANAFFSSDELIKSSYFVQLNSFQPNYNVLPIQLQAKTGSLNLGNINPYEITAPTLNEKLVLGNNYKIIWKGNPNRPVDISITNKRGFDWHITNPNQSLKSYTNNIYLWTVGKIYTYNSKGEWFQTDLDSGEYKIIVYDGKVREIKGESDYFNIVESATSTPVIASSIKLLDRKVLNLQYDQFGGESALISTFDVIVTAGSKDQKISKYNAFSSYVQTDTGINSWGSTQYARPVNIMDDGDYYVIPAGISAKFTVITKFYPNRMFAGVYYGVMGQIALGDYRINPLFVPFPPPNTTNKVVIIGELSPYINSISSPKEGVAPDTMVTLSGVRFPSKGNVVNLINVLTGQKTTVFAIGSGNGTILQFKPNVPAGNYVVSVTHPTTGDSNGWGLIVTPLANPFSPSIKIPSSNSSLSAPTTPVTAPMINSVQTTPAPQTTSVPQTTVTPLPSVQPKSIPLPSPSTSQTSSVSEAFQNLLKAFLPIF